MHELNSAEEVFNELGLETISSLTGSKPKAALNWKYGNAFPPRTYLTLTEELKKRGKCAPASLWKMAEPAAAEAS